MRQKRGEIRVIWCMWCAVEGGAVHVRGGGGGCGGGGAVVIVIALSSSASSSSSHRCFS